MKIRLGYACISNIINITSSKTTTLTFFNKLDSDNKFKKLDFIINENLNSLKSLVKYNIKNNIHFFRITAKMIPLMDLYEIDLNLYKSKFIEIGKLIKNSNMRVDVHADQFCVLNSVNEEVVLNSIKILNNLKTVMDMFNVSYNIILHVGSKSNGIKSGVKRFITNFNLLDSEIRKLIILENDDKNYNVFQTLNLCEKLNIPMCMADLKRISIDNFSINNSYTLEDIKNGNFKFYDVSKLFNYKKVEIDTVLEKKILNGCKLDNIYNLDNVLFTKNNKLFALYRKNDCNMLVKAFIF